MEEQEICKACGHELDDHFPILAPNGVAVLGQWGPDGNTKILCYPDSISKEDFPKCICCDEPILESKAAHAGCTETIIEERNHFQQLAIKRA